MREMPHIGSIVQIGMRGLGSSSRRDWEEARAANTVITAKDFHRLGVEKVLAQIPAGKTFITFDIDATTFPSCPPQPRLLPGGCSMMRPANCSAASAQKTDIIGFDLVETAPSYDTPATTGCRLAALTMLHIMGRSRKKHWHNFPSLIIMVQNEHII